jgi:hypothetical protein
MYESRSKVVDSVVEVIPTTCGHTGFESHDVNVIWPGYTSSYEAVTPNSSRDKRSWKTFHHYKRGVQPTVGVTARGSAFVHVNSFPHDFDTVASSYPYAFYCNEFGAPGVHDSGLRKLFDPTMDFGFVPDPSDLNNLKQASLNSMMPQVKAKLSLVNSLIELKDFKSLPKTIGNIYKVSKSIPSLWRNTSSTLRRLLHASADGYLQTQFNILPLLSDIAGVRSALSSTLAQINKLVSEQGQTIKRHYRRPMDIDASDLQETTFTSGGNYGSNYPIGAVSHASRQVYTDKAIFHAEIVYNYNYTQYQVEHAQLFGLLDALGVNLNPAIIWNAIPWTFVVDWVLGISRWLNDRKLLNMEPVVNIQNYLWSITYRRRILVSRRLERATRFHEFTPNDTVTDHSISFPVVTESAYRRDVGLPSTSSIVSSGLSLKEFSLGAALVVTRGTHHKRNRSR